MEITYVDAHELRKGRVCGQAAGVGIARLSACGCRWGDSSSGSGDSGSSTRGGLLLGMLARELLLRGMLGLQASGFRSGSTLPSGLLLDMLARSVLRRGSYLLVRGLFLKGLLTRFLCCANTRDFFLHALPLSLGGSSSSRSVCLSLLFGLSGSI